MRASSAALQLFYEAFDAFDGGDLERYFELMRQGAEKGESLFFLTLGVAYDDGVGTPVDTAKALHWYVRDFNTGGSGGASNIACYYRDRGRHRLAALWMKRAAALRSGGASLDLAKSYLSGQGVGRSPSRAKRALRRALRAWERPWRGIVRISEDECLEARQLLRLLQRLPA